MTDEKRYNESTVYRLIHQIEEIYYYAGVYDCTNDQDAKTQAIRNVRAGLRSFKDESGGGIFPKGIIHSENMKKLEKIATDTFPGDWSNPKEIGW